jgi:hypothetical protein
MLFAEDLLDLARDIADMDADNPRQASLRRAVSTAYYALFHLLISEATSNWRQVELRPALGRIFEHGKMKNASSNRAQTLNAKRDIEKDTSRSSRAGRCGQSAGSCGRLPAGSSTKRGC